MDQRMVLRIAGIVVLASLMGFHDQFDNVTDRDIRYNGETYKGRTVEMSCRMGTIAEKFEIGQFNSNNSVMFPTLDHNVEVIIENRHDGVIKELRALASGEEITVYGKAYKYPAGKSYVVIHKFVKGFTTEYKPEDRKYITLYWNGTVVKMERGKTYTERAPVSQEAIEIRWE